MAAKQGPNVLLSMANRTRSILFISVTVHVCVCVCVGWGGSRKLGRAWVERQERSMRWQHGAMAHAIQEREDAVKVLPRPTAAQTPTCHTLQGSERWHWQGLRAARVFDWQKELLRASDP
jgi:hypothetical protein